MDASRQLSPGGTSASDPRRALGNVRRLVVKIGSSLITSEKGIEPEKIEAVAAEIARIRGSREVVLVTSGAITAGVARLALAERPRSIPEKQAAAAVGQSALMWHYEAAFKRHGIGVGQVLLTAQDIGDRTRYLNARNTLLALLRLDVLPVVNENDTVAVEEIKVGDNDNLSALVASLIEADLLVLLTDVDGLYTDDPAAQCQRSQARYGGCGHRGDRSACLGAGQRVRRRRHGHQAAGGPEGGGGRDSHGHRQRA